MKPFTGLLPGRGRPPVGDATNLPRSAAAGQDAAGFEALGFDPDLAADPVEPVDPADPDDEDPADDDDPDDDDPDDDPDESDVFGAGRESVR
ncbi:hypothetical protein GCM10017714_30660 [Curtobacterium pusillum]|nr:hypothetical protein GCM10017610_24220 [Curtobacterium pusillum]